MAEKAYQIKSKAIETKPPGRQMQAEPSHVLPYSGLISKEIYFWIFQKNLLLQK